MDNPIYALVRLASFALTLLTWAIIIRAVLSWVRPDPRNVFVQLIDKVTDPVLRPIGRFIPSLGGIDITPLVAIILIQLVQRVLPALIGY